VKWVKSSSTLFIDRVSDFRSGVTSPELKYICVIDSVESVWTKFKEEAQKEREHNHEGELEGIAEAIPHLVWATEVSISLLYSLLIFMIQFFKHKLRHEIIAKS
jgi:hypothetical protein